MNTDWVASRIVNDEFRNENLSQMKITHKAGVKQMYEHACHAQNIWAKLWT